MMKRCSVVLIVALLGIAACDPAGDVASTASTGEHEPTASPVATPPDSPPASALAARAPDSFCDAATTAAEGHGGLDSLPEHPGLTSQQRDTVRRVVRESREQIDRGNGWDTTELVEVINEMCGLELTPVTMVP